MDMKIISFFLFLRETICCAYSLKAPRRGAFDEYPQYIILCEDEKR